MKHQAIAVSSTMLAAATTMLWMQTTPAQVQPDAKCPPACTLSIEVPENPGRAPEINVKTLYVSPGDLLEIDTNRAVILRFEGGQSPFVDQHGRSIDTLVIKPGRAQSFKARTEGGDCKEAPGCKYSVQEQGNQRRPVLDPYIIIQ
ncbi:MAG: hypothetical protein Kow0020_05850 [Wenzhouxiangellaceae bacterium]